MVKKQRKSVQVAVVMGSDSDWEIMKEAASALKMLKIPHEVSILSAHRTPKEVAQFAEKARKKGVRVIIAGAGGAAHLPGMVAAHTELPVIGVPVPLGHLRGQDALYSIVQMPRGVPVATVGIGNAFNAGILAVQILGTAKTGGVLLDRIAKYKADLRKKVRAKKLPQK